MTTTTETQTADIWFTYDGVADHLSSLDELARALETMHDELKFLEQQGWQVGYHEHDRSGYVTWVATKDCTREEAVKTRNDFCSTRTLDWGEELGI